MAKEEFDIFHRSKIYPNADQIFVTGLPDIKSVIKDCIFVVDTNALLVPFATGSESLEAITKIFTELKKRKQLKVPEQVAREFADNRPTKIGEMFYALNQKRNANVDVKIGSYPLLEALPEYSEILEIENELKTLLTKYRNTIGKVVDVVKAWSWDDPVSLIYRKLFTPELIHKLTADEATIQKDLSYRYLHKIPPGYKDGGKEDSGIGDLLIWLAILDIGSSNKNVVFVSGDVKPDWYHKSNKEALYPRFELLAEFRAKSNNHSFYMIRLSELLALMGAEEKVVSEVKMEEQIEIEKFSTPRHIIAERAVYNDYKSRYGSVSLEPLHSRAPYDFTFFDGDSILTGVSVISHKADFGHFRYFIRDRMARLFDSEFPDEMTFLDIVTVSPVVDFDFDKLIAFVKEIIPRSKLRQTIRFYAGYLDIHQEFKIMRGII